MIFERFTPSKLNKQSSIFHDRSRVPLRLVLVTQRLAVFRYPPTISQQRPKGLVSFISSDTFHTVRRETVHSHFRFFLRKEVIQPHLPIQLPCYASTPLPAPPVPRWL